MGRWAEHVPRGVGQIQEGAAAAQTAWGTQTLRLQPILELGAVPALSAGGAVSLSGSGEGGSVEGAGGVRVQGRLGEGAAAPGGGRRGVRAQGGASWPVQQLEVAEAAGGAEDLTGWRRAEEEEEFHTGLTQTADQ